jgi:CRP-like cAMP-binding protein
MSQTLHLANQMLATLTQADRDALLPHLKVVELPQELVLFDAGDTVKAIYFPHAGIVSLVVDLTSGDMIEAAMVGRDGVVGGSAALNGDMSLNKAVVQLTGRASIAEVDRVRSIAESSVVFRTALMRHEQFVMAQAQQSAACNAAHAVEARISRWLLRCRDLAGSDDIALTQEFLAEMMGVRRTSVSLVANTLQQAGLIKYRRGHIRILDVEGLQEAACECYETVRTHADRLLKGPAHH